MFQDLRAQRQLPAFLTAWKVMFVLRSFQNESGKVKEKFLQADFASLRLRELFIARCGEACREESHSPDDLTSALAGCFGTW
jgi:hypothetical protein